MCYNTNMKITKIQPVYPVSDRRQKESNQHAHQRDKQDSNKQDKNTSTLDVYG